MNVMTEYVNIDDKGPKLKGKTAISYDFDAELGECTGCDPLVYPNT